MWQQLASPLRLVVLCLAGVSACDPGWHLEGQVVPQPGVALDRQLVILLSTDVELYLGAPTPDGFTKRARVLKAVDHMGGDEGVRFSFFTVGCHFERFQVVALSPKERIRLPGVDESNEPVRLKPGDYLAKTPLLDVTDCGATGTQNVVLPLTADEWSPTPSPAP